MSNIYRFIAITSFLLSVATWIFILLGLLLNNNDSLSGLPSAIFFGTTLLLPTYELRRNKQLRPFGLSFRAWFICLLDVLISDDVNVSVLHWEVFWVGLAAIFVFYGGLFRKFVARLIS